MGGDLEVQGTTHTTTLNVHTIAAEGTDVDKFLVDSSALVKYRTGAQVLSDIGASASSHLHDGRYYTETELGSNSNALGASLIGIEDSAAQFDATDVEAALSELIVLVTPVEYNPAMSRTVGGDAGGNDASVATIDDADSYDTDEVNATPGFDIQAVFTGVTDFNQVQIHTAYDGNPAHVVRIDLDKTPFNWSSFDTILADIDDSSGDFVFKAITVASAAQYINSGEVRLRFYHSSAGNATHDFFIDYCALWKTGTSVGVTEHGGLTGLSDDDHLQYIKDVEFTQDSGILVGTGAGTFAEETGATLRTSIGLGTGDSPTFAGGVIHRISDDINAPILSFLKERITGQTVNDNDYAGGLLFRFYNDAGTPEIVDAARIRVKILDASDGTEDTHMDFRTIVNGSLITGLTITGTQLVGEGSLKLKEQAAADGDTAAYGQVWVKTATPNELWFTDDAGTDVPISTPFSAYTTEDSNSDAMLHSHAYKAATDGFVSVLHTIAAAGNILYGYVGTTTDPPNDGDLIRQQEADANGSQKSIFFAVAKDEYFEIRRTAGTPTILWKSVGVLSKPVDQD